MSSKDSHTEASSSQDPTAFLRSASFSRGEGPATSPDNAVTASDLLLGAYDPTKLHPIAGLGEKLDYLLLEDDKTSELPGAGTAIPSRGWSDDLCYGTGTMYLSGVWRSLSVSKFCHVISALSLTFSLSGSTLTLSRHLENPSLVVLLFCLVTCSSTFYKV